MSDSNKTPKNPEELQKELQGFLKEKFGADIFAIPLGKVAGPGAETAAVAPEEGQREVPEEILRFDKTPREIKEHLDRYVVGQEEAKRTLAVAVCDHYNHVRRMIAQSASASEESPGEEEVEYVKQNVMLLGPTGVGKTYLIRILAQLIGVPFVKADITKFSETGYVGGDVEDLVRELHRIAGGDHALASHGMIFLDEIDKIASAPSAATGRDPSGRGVQVALLKLMEDTEVSLRNPFDLGAQFQDLMQMRQGAVAKRTINTRHILFVVSGAFSGLEGIIEKRTREGSVGFGTGAREGDLPGEERGPLSGAVTKDFVEYGFEPEFIGRLPIRVVLDDLAEEDLFEILRSSEGSILRQHRENFRGYGLEIEFTDEALRAIARRAHAEGTGARGLMTVLESCLRDFKFCLPGGPVRRLGVTERLVDDPAAVLRETLEAPERAHHEHARVCVRAFEESFRRECGVRLRLDDEAVEMASSVSSDVGLPLGEYLEKTFGAHRDFLVEVYSRASRDVLPVPPHVLHRPAEGVAIWLAAQAEKEER